MHRVFPLIALEVGQFDLIPRVCEGIANPTGQSYKDTESYSGEVILGKPPVDTGVGSSFLSLFRPWQELFVKATFLAGR